MGGHNPPQSHNLSSTVFSKFLAPCGRPNQRVWWQQCRGHANFLVIYLSQCLTPNWVAESKQADKNLCPGGAYVLKRWFTKCGSWICSISIIWELVSNPHFQAVFISSPRPLDSETFKKDFQVILMQTQVWEPTNKMEKRDNKQDEEIICDVLDVNRCCG